MSTSALQCDTVDLPGARAHESAEWTDDRPHRVHTVSVLAYGASLLWCVAQNRLTPLSASTHTVHVAALVTACLVLLPLLRKRAERLHCLVVVFPLLDTVLSLYVALTDDGRQRAYLLRAACASLVAVTMHLPHGEGICLEKRHARPKIVLIVTWMSTVMYAACHVRSALRQPSYESALHIVFHFLVITWGFAARFLHVRQETAAGRIAAIFLCVEIVSAPFSLSLADGDPSGAISASFLLVAVAIVWQHEQLHKLHTGSLFALV